MTQVYPIVENTQALEAALARLRGPVALDTEFHAEQVYTPRLMLLQLRDLEGEPVLVDPLALQDLRPLGRALESRTLIIHALNQDLLLLNRAAGFQPVQGQIVDPQVLAGFCGLGYPRSLTDLVYEVLGQRLPPSSSMSDWSRRPLSEEQRRYAAADVLWLHALVDALRARLSPEHQRWAEAATWDLCQASLSSAPPDGQWQRIGGAGVLDARGRAALKALVQWREEHARAMNQPRWQIATDVILLDLARRRPRSPEDLSGNRKLPKRLLSQWGPQLLRLLAEVERRPLEDAPDRVFNRGGPVAADVHLSAWALGVEARRGIAAELALPQDLRRALVARWLRGEDEILLSGWRAEAFGSQLSDLVNGRIALKFSEEFRRVPEESGLQ